MRLRGVPVPVEVSAKEKDLREGAGTKPGVQAAPAAAKLRGGGPATKAPGAKR